MRTAKTSETYALSKESFLKKEKGTLLTGGGSVMEGYNLHKKKTQLIVRKVGGRRGHETSCRQLRGEKKKTSDLNRFIWAQGGSKRGCWQRSAGEHCLSGGVVLEKTVSTSGLLITLNEGGGVRESFITARLTRTD